MRSSKFTEEIIVYRMVTSCEGTAICVTAEEREALDKMEPSDAIQWLDSITSSESEVRGGHVCHDEYVDIGWPDEWYDVGSGTLRDLDEELGQ